MAAGYFIQLAPPLGMSLLQAPFSMKLMFAAKLIALGRIVTRCGSITHYGELSRGEQL
jgi:hypothetical protein